MKKLIYILFIVSLLSLSSCSAIVEAAAYGTTHAIIDNQLGYSNYYNNSIYYYRTPYYYPRSSQINQYKNNANRYKINTYKGKAYRRKSSTKKRPSRSTTGRRN